jgi:hypothetical protein
LTSLVVDPGNPNYSSQDGVIYNKAKTALVQYPAGKPGGYTIPATVTSSEPSAFAYCPNLTSVTIPNSVTSLGDQTFRNCSNLTSVSIGSSVTGIGELAFAGCSGLTQVVIPDSVTSVGDQAFYGSSGLESVIIGEGVTGIGDNAFTYCSNLTTAYFEGDAPATVGTGVFDNAASDFTVTHPADSSGFTDTWNGYPTEVGEPPPTAPPTVIELSSFTALVKNRKVILSWSTGSEINNSGFNIYRAESENGQYTKINTSLIPAQGSATQGANYEFTDTEVQNRKTYFYKLEDIDLSGKSTKHGPISAMPRLIYGIGK